MEATNQNHHAETVAAMKQQRKREPFRSALRPTFQPRSRASSWRCHHHREFIFTLPPQPLKTKHHHLCTSNQIRDHHCSSGDVSSIAAANQNSANSNHASTHQRREFSHHSFVLHLAGNTHRDPSSDERIGVRSLRENWGRRWIVIEIRDLGILTGSMASVEGDPNPKGATLMKFIN